MVGNAMEASAEPKQKIGKICGMGDNSSKRSTTREMSRIGGTGSFWEVRQLLVVSQAHNLLIVIGEECKSETKKTSRRRQCRREEKG